MTENCPEGYTSVQPQCITAPCPYYCVDKDGKIYVPKDDKSEVTQTKPNNTNKWLAIIGLTALAYFILYKSGSLK